MTRTVYRIREWRQHFEVSQSLRIVGPLAWVGLPTKHDGKSYRRMIRLPNGPALFGCWCLIVQTAAKCPNRGVLADSDGPLTSEDMEAKTGCPASLFDETIQLLLSKQINWLEEVDFSSIKGPSPPALGEECENTPSTGQTEPTEPDLTGQITGAGLGAGHLKRTESGNGTDGRFRDLDKIKPDHLPRIEVLERLHAALCKTAPEIIKPGDEGLLAILAAAERAIAIGKKPVALFVSIVREGRFDLCDDRQRRAAKEHLEFYRQRKAELKTIPMTVTK